jgi:hypothetical protein
MTSHHNNLILDEQSFQGLLAAAFTIQEHNDKRTRQASAVPDVCPEPEPSSTCPHCGASKPADGSRCLICGLDEFRPGERMQRKWASMWLMSQDQSLWPERAPEKDDTRPESMQNGVLTPSATRATQTQNLRDSANNGLRATPTAKATADEADETTAEEEPDSARGGLRAKSTRTNSAPANSTFDDHIGDHTAADRAWPLNAGDSRYRPDLQTDDAPFTLEPYQLSVSKDFFPEVTSSDAAIEPPADAGAVSLMQRLAGWRVVLRFHRADLYLGVAVLVAVIAVLWPSASPPHRPTLGPVQRAMVELGIAEAPAPASVHLQGDPSIEVWVDPHTALYYCPGEEHYGKTTNGRFTSQRDAQMDQFEPASRSACE